MCASPGSFPEPLGHERASRARRRAHTRTQSGLSGHLWGRGYPLIGRMGPRKTKKNKNKIKDKTSLGTVLEAPQITERGREDPGEGHTLT